jgi:hypothetical protein
MLDLAKTWFSFEHYVLCAAQVGLDRVQPDSAQFERVSGLEAERAIALALNDAGLRRALLRLWSDAQAPSVQDAGRSLAAGQWVATMLLRAGAPLMLLRRRLPRITGPLSLAATARAAVPSEPPVKQGVTLEFEVLYDDDDCAAGLSYEVTGPSGPIVGRLDRHGYAFHDPVDPGGYRATFGKGTEPPKIGDKGWLDLELTDSSGAPMAGAKYQLKLSSGELREGVLDQNGRLVLAGVPEGDHEFTFPEIDVAMVEGGADSGAEASA